MAFLLEHCFFSFEEEKTNLDFFFDMRHNKEIQVDDDVELEEIQHGFSVDIVTQHIPLLLSVDLLFSFRNEQACEAVPWNRFMSEVRNRNTFVKRYEKDDLSLIVIYDMLTYKETRTLKKNGELINHVVIYNQNLKTIFSFFSQKKAQFFKEISGRWTTTEILSVEMSVYHYQNTIKLTQ
jgi:hypothetical protein